MVREREEVECVSRGCRLFIECWRMSRHAEKQLGGHDTMTDPGKLIAIMRVILSELEQTLSTAPERTDEDSDPRTDHLKTRIDRLDAVLKKREAHIRRQKALEKQNRKNNPRR